ncbi:hypothetical protein ADL27_50070, partial [Streptomyces sp. NRRL F-6602]
MDITPPPPATYYVQTTEGTVFVVEKVSIVEHGNGWLRLLDADWVHLLVTPLDSVAMYGTAIAVDAPETRGH